MRLPITLLMSSALLVGTGCTGVKNPFPGQGITNDYRSYIPMSAKKVASGSGAVTYTADAQGQVYVVDLGRTEQTTKDTTAPFVVGSALVLKGQTVSVDAVAQTITISAIKNVTATTFTNKNLSTGSGFEIYFDPSPVK